MPGRKRPARELTNDAAGGNGGGSNDGQGPNVQDKEKPARRQAGRARNADVSGRYLRPADGSAVQPHRRHAARLSGTGRQTIRSAIPTTTPGGRSASCSTSRSCASPTSKVLDAPMELVKGELTAAGGVNGTRRRLRRSITTPIRRSPTLRYRFKDAQYRRRRGAVRGRRRRNSIAGSFIVRSGDQRDDLGKAATELGLKVVAPRRGAVGEDASRPAPRASP